MLVFLFVPKKNVVCYNYHTKHIFMHGKFFFFPLNVSHAFMYHFPLYHVNFHFQDHAGDNRREEESMNGDHNHRHKAEGLGGNGTPTSHRGSHKHRSSDNGFSSTPSLSRSASRKSNSNTPIKSHLFRSLSKKSTQSMPSPAHMGRKGKDSTPSPPVLSRNTSRGSNSSRIMYSNSSGMLKPPPIEKKLECTLEELCYGSTRKVKITREVVTDTGFVTMLLYLYVSFG